MELKWKYLDELYREKYFDKDVPPVYLKSEADKVIARHKYKRCLAMAYAEWLKQMNLYNFPESILYRRAARRERKWKEMAQNFKEAK